MTLVVGHVVSLQKARRLSNMPKVPKAREGQKRTWGLVFFKAVCPAQASWQYSTSILPATLLHLWFLASSTKKIDMSYSAEKLGTGWEGLPLSLHYLVNPGNNNKSSLALEFRMLQNLSVFLCLAKPSEFTNAFSSHFRSSIAWTCVPWREPFEIMFGRHSKWPSIWNIWKVLFNLQLLLFLKQRLQCQIGRNEILFHQLLGHTGPGKVPAMLCFSFLTWR